MRSSTLSSLVATTLAFTLVEAYTCSQSEQQTGYGLFRAAAARSGCASYANYGADGTVTINWSCSTTSCTPTMMQLALQLPNCETASDGVNRKKNLEDKLYNQCQLCTPDQQDQIVALWKSAAQTSACSPYATAGGTWFSWPCSATSCTATLKDLAYKVPSCFIGTQNERTRILNGISACTGTTVSTRTPAPAGTSSGTSTTAPPATRPPTTPAPPRTTNQPTTNPPTTATPSSTAESSGDKDESITSTPSSTSDVASTCNATQIDTMMDLYVKTARGTNCRTYGTVSPWSVQITAPCSSSCVVIDINNLEDALPDCFYTYESENKKKTLKDKLDQCKPVSGRRALLGEATEKYLTLSVSSKDVIRSATTVPSGSTTRPPTMSDATSLTMSTWLIAAVFALIFSL